MVKTTYVVKSGAILMPETTFEVTPAGCLFTPTKTMLMSNGSPLESFLTYTPDSGVTIDTDSIYDWGVYTIQQFNVLDDGLLTTGTSVGIIEIEPCPLTEIIGSTIEAMAIVIDMSASITQEISPWSDTVHDALV